MQAAFAILCVCCLLVHIRITAAHALASKARSWPNMDEKGRGLEPAVSHIKAKELIFWYSQQSTMV